jgi:hypothetical protein
MPNSALTAGETNGSSPLAAEAETKNPEKQ